MWRWTRNERLQWIEIRERNVDDEKGVEGKEVITYKENRHGKGK